MRVEFLADEDRPGGWLVLLDRVRQSYVDIDDPGYLEFPYVQALAQALGALRTGPLTVLHLGGAALTLPRWVEHTRPGSRQVVAEPDTEMIGLVRARLPMPQGDLSVLAVDGRSALRLPDTAGPFDAVVVDAFAGGRVPGELVTGEFFAEVSARLAPDGLLAMNVADRAGLGWVRRLVAAAAGSFGEVVLRAEPEVLAGADSGNVIVCAGRHLRIEVVMADDDPFDYETVPLAGASLAEFTGDARPFTDADTARSPEPDEDRWRV